MTRASFVMEFPRDGAGTDLKLHSVSNQSRMLVCKLSKRFPKMTFTSTRKSTLVMAPFLQFWGLPSIHSVPVQLGCTSCLFLLYSQSSRRHTENEWGVRELREALLQLSRVKGKTSRIWVQRLVFKFWHVWKFHGESRRKRSCQGFLFAF